MSADDAEPVAAGPFAVEPQWLERLDAAGLVAIVDQLLRAEVTAHALPDAEIEVSSHLSAPDGGEDARITWVAGLERTDRLPGRLVQFQLKATPMRPSVTAKEIRAKGTAKGGALQPMVADVLDRGGFYRLICTHLTPCQGKQKREQALRDAVRSSGRSIPDDRVGFVDGDALASWISRYPAVARRTRELLNIPSGGPFRSWHHELERAEHSQSITVPDPRRIDVLAKLAGRIGAPKGVVRVAGSTGVGKSRLVLDAIGEMSTTADGEEARSLALFVCIGQGGTRRRC